MSRPRGLGEHADRDALDHQPRHFVAETELAVQPVREVNDVAATKRLRFGQQPRVLTRPCDPAFVDIDDHARRPGPRHDIRVRLERVPEQEHRRCVGRGFAPSHFCQAAAQHQHEPGVWMRVAPDPLSGLLAHFSEHESADERHRTMSPCVKFRGGCASGTT